MLSLNYNNNNTLKIQLTEFPVFDIIFNHYKYECNKEKDRDWL